MPSLWRLSGRRLARPLFLSHCDVTIALWLTRCTVRDRSAARRAPRREAAVVSAPAGQNHSLVFARSEAKLERGSAWLRFICRRRNCKRRRLRVTNVAIASFSDSRSPPYNEFGVPRCQVEALHEVDIAIVASAPISGRSV